MASPSRFPCFICTIFLFLVTIAIAESDFLHNFFINNGNYTDNSTYQTNLKSLLSSISSNTQIDYGFYNFSAGQNSDRVNAIALCRGDISLDNCRSCVNDSSHKLTQICPYYKDAIGWYDNCMLRYSTGSNIFGATQAGLSFNIENPNNASTQFNDAFAELMADLRTRAASGDARRKFATGKLDATSNQSVYVSAVAAVILIVCICIYLRVRKPRKKVEKLPRTTFLMLTSLDKEDLGLFTR